MTDPIGRLCVGILRRAQESLFVQQRSAAGGFSEPTGVDICQQLLHETTAGRYGPRPRRRADRLQGELILLCGPLVSLEQTVLSVCLSCSSL